MQPALPPKVAQQIRKAGLPTGGTHPFRPRLVPNLRGEQVIEKKPVLRGPKIGKRGFMDTQGRIWVRDRAHAGLPDHWDVQINAGMSYFRVDLNGNEIS